MSYWSRSFPGIAECLSEVRRFTAAVLGDRPGVDLVVLVTSELAGNAILHTASGDPGGQFVVHIAAFADRWQIRVDDAGGPGYPRFGGAPSSAAADFGGLDGGLDGQDGLDGHDGLNGLDDIAAFDIAGLAEAGRGLALVAAISRAWGVLGDEYARAVWAEIPHPRPEASAESTSLPQQTSVRQERVTADVR